MAVLVLVMMIVLMVMTMVVECDGDLFRRVEVLSNLYWCLQSTLLGQTTKIFDVVSVATRQVHPYVVLDGLGVADPRQKGHEIIHFVVRNRPPEPICAALVVIVGGAKQALAPHTWSVFDV